jgi:hypothetical protein
MPYLLRLVERRGQHEELHRPWISRSAKAAKRRPLPDTGADYTDPCSLPNDLLIFSSDVTGMGGHDLFLAGFQSTDIQALDQVVPLVNTKLEELGASFWIQR